LPDFILEIIISLKNWRESQETISVLKCFAKSMANLVFPIPVGPTTEIKFLFFTLLIYKN